MGKVKLIMWYLVFIACVCFWVGGMVYIGVAASNEDPASTRDTDHDDLVECNRLGYHYVERSEYNGGYKVINRLSSKDYVCVL